MIRLLKEYREAKATKQIYDEYQLFYKGKIEDRTLTIYYMESFQEFLRRGKALKDKVLEWPSPWNKLVRRKAVNGQKMRKLSGLKGEQYR